LLEYERVHSRIRKFADLPAGRRLAACNGYVKVGADYPARGAPPDPANDIVVTDVSTFYFDQRTGRKVAECGYWFCLKNNKLCDAQCPFPGWTCEGVDTGEPMAPGEAR
jgi:hypothetical protein